MPGISGILHPFPRTKQDSSGPGPTTSKTAEEIRSRLESVSETERDYRIEFIG